MTADPKNPKNDSLIQKVRSFWSRDRDEVKVESGAGGGNSSVNPPGEVPPPSPLDEQGLPFPSEQESRAEPRTTNRSKWQAPVEPPELRSKWHESSEQEPPNLPNPVFIPDNPFSKLAALKDSKASTVHEPVRPSLPPAKAKQGSTLTEHLKELQVAFDQLRILSMQHKDVADLKEIDKKYNKGQFFNKCNELNSIFPDKLFHSKLRTLVHTAAALQKQGAEFSIAKYSQKKDYDVRSKLTKARHEFAIAKRDLEKEISSVGSQARMRR